MKRLSLVVIAAALLLAGSLSARAALDPAQVNQLAAEDSSDKVAAIRQLTQTADPDAVRVLKAMSEDGLYLAGDKAVIIDGDQAFDAATGTKIRIEIEIGLPSVEVIFLIMMSFVIEAT